MVNRGVSVRVVPEVLGRASITTTEGYSKGLVGSLYDEVFKGVK